MFTDSFTMRLLLFSLIAVSSTIVSAAHLGNKIKTFGYDDSCNNIMGLCLTRGGDFNSCQSLMFSCQAAPDGPVKDAANLVYNICMRPVDHSPQQCAVLYNSALAARDEDRAWTCASGYQACIFQRGDSQQCGEGYNNCLRSGIAAGIQHAKFFSVSTYNRVESLLRPSVECDMIESVCQTVGGSDSLCKSLYWGCETGQSSSRPECSSQLCTPLIMQCFDLEGNPEQCGRMYNSCQSGCGSSLDEDQLQKCNEDVRECLNNGPPFDTCEMTYNTCLAGQLAMQSSYNKYGRVCGK